MSEYPKINSLWKREGFDFNKTGIKPNGKKLIPNEYSCPEFGAVKWWDVEEKIDGTNIRVFFKDGVVTFGGRTKDAQIPCHLLEYLQKTFTASIMSARFQKEGETPPYVILYGEGYGPKIQSGGYYSKEVGFCLYDVRVGNWWLEKDVVRYKIAGELGVRFPTPYGIMTQEAILELVKSNPYSLFAENDPKHEHPMEGVICRSSPLMLFRRGEPIMWKLKCKDFV